MDKICFASFAGLPALLLLFFATAGAADVESWKNTSTLTGPAIATTYPGINSTLTISSVSTNPLHKISTVSALPNPTLSGWRNPLKSNETARPAASTLPQLHHQVATTSATSPMFTLITDSSERPFPHPPATATSAAESSTPSPALQCHLFIKQQFDDIAGHPAIHMSAYIGLFDARGATQGINDTIEYSYTGIRPGWTGVFLLNGNGYMQISLRKARKSEVRNGGEEWTDWVWDFGVHRKDSELRWSSSNQGGSEGFPGCWVQRWADSRVNDSHGRGVSPVPPFFPSPD